MSDAAVYFTNYSHRKHCKDAGCKHPATYNTGKEVLQGWCPLCLALAFGDVR